MIPSATDGGRIAEENRMEPTPAPTPSPSRGRGRFLFGLAAILIVAAGLRIAAATGELWFDEVWSVQLIRPIGDVGGIFWGIDHDNNHFLNSLWMWSVGLDSSPLVLRAASIAMGLVTVAAAGLFGLRRGRTTALASAAAVAVAYGEVHYASEARGWAGMIAALMVTILLVERALDRGPSRGLAVLLGIVAVVGLGWQLFLLPAFAMTALFAINAEGMRRFEVGGAVRFGLATFWAAGLGVVFVLGGLAVVRRIHGLTTGGFEPYSFGDLVDGLGTMTARSLGLPEATPAAAAVLLVAILLVATVVLGRGRTDHRNGLWIAFLVGLPGLMIVTRLPNVFMPRYHLATVTVLLLMSADLVALLWARGRGLRIVAVVLAGGFLFGNAAQLAHFYRDGRGHQQEAVARMAVAGPIVASGDHDLRGSLLLAHAARRLGVDARWIDAADLCRDRPDWLLVEDAWRWNLRVRPILANCPIAFHRAFRVGHWGLSGAAWTVYRVDGAAATLSEVADETP
jgi:hypothetical protein